MYNTRMLGYYPQVIQTIQEFKAIVDSEAPEFEELHFETGNVTNDAWLTTMCLERITQWEGLLGIKPVPNSTESDRRETIIARIRGQGKLNTELINTIVKTFTGGTANSYIKDSTLYVEITPPPENKSFIFENVEQEIAKKVPAHLNYRVTRNYLQWGEVQEQYPTWQDIYEEFENWGSVSVTLKTN